MLPPQGGLFDWAMAIVGGLLLGLLAALDHLRPSRPAGGVRPDGGPARRRRERAADAAPRLEDLPGGRVQQAAGRRAPRGRAAGDRAGRRGQPQPAAAAAASERRKHERVAADTPIHEVVCGRGEGEVPLPKLVKYIQKLGRAVKPAELTDVLNRIKALDANRSNIPLPKGPVPTSMKGMRGNMRGR